MGFDRSHSKRSPARGSACGRHSFLPHMQCVGIQRGTFMETSLQGANLMAKQIQTLEATHRVGEQAEEEHQVHLPNPSGWPIMLSVAVGVAVVGLFFIPESPWLTIIAAPFVLVGIMGWALEDPMASPYH